jgi:hypothetical protein
MQRIEYCPCVATFVGFSSYSYAENRSRYRGIVMHLVVHLVVHIRSREAIAR